MAPREIPKVTPKRNILKTSDSRKTMSASTSKKATAPASSVKRTLENVPKPNKVAVDAKQQPSADKKENKPVPVPGSVTKSAKKPTWKRRPKPAHSGVPVPEKMKRLLQKRLQDLDCSF